MRTLAGVIRAKGFFQQRTTGGLLKNVYATILLFIGLDATLISLRVVVGVSLILSIFDVG